MSTAEKLENGKLKWVGTRPVRPDGVDKVTGRARFGADLSLPGMLVGRVNGFNENFFRSFLIRIPIEEPRRHGSIIIGGVVCVADHARLSGGEETKTEQTGKKHVFHG